MPLSRKIAVAGCAALALASAACSSSSGGSGAGTGASGASGQPYRLLVVAPLSGVLKSVGVQYTAGVDYAVQQINAHGGILGRKIAMTTVDDQGQPTQAVTLVQKALAGGNRPDAVYAGTTSNEALAMVPLLSRAKIINTNITGTDVLNDPAKYPYTFRPDPSTLPYAAYLGKALKAKGYKKVVLVSDNNALGQSVAASETAGLKAAGIEVGSATYSDSDLDLGPTLQRAQSQHPDAVIFGTLLPQTSALVLQARVKVGMTSIPFYADASTSCQAASLVPKSDLDGVWIATYKINFSDGQTPALKSLMAAINQRIGTPTTNVLAYSWNADAIKLLQVAAAQAKSVDADKMKAALENLAAQPAGTYLSFAQYKFSPSSHDNLAVSDSDFEIGTFGPMVDGVCTAPPAS